MRGHRAELGEEEREMVEQKIKKRITSMDILTMPESLYQLLFR